MNELILRTVTAVVTFMIILFGIQLFFCRPLLSRRRIHCRPRYRRRHYFAAAGV